MRQYGVLFALRFPRTSHVRLLEFIFSQIATSKTQQSTLFEVPHFSIDGTQTPKTNSGKTRVSRQRTHQRPVVPRYGRIPLSLFQSAQHHGPQISLQLHIEERKSTPQDFLNLFVSVVVQHHLTPVRRSYFLSARTARNTLTLIALSDFPNDSAISLYGLSSIRASVAVT
jgi:hypothetical protein